MAGKSVLDQLAEGVRHAAEDIRQKVVEELWFGREATDKTQTPEQPPEGFRPGMGYEAHYSFGRTPETQPGTDSCTAFEQFAGIGPAREQSAANDSRNEFDRFVGIGPAKESPEPDRNQERDIER